MSRVLVYQANGVQGAATLRGIMREGFAARALIRNASRAADFTARGVEVAVADLMDRDALIRAHESIDYVVVQIPAHADAFVASAVDNAVCAMESAGVQGAVIKMANPTPVRAEPDSGFSANAIVLERMRRSTIRFSVVEPTMYLDTFLKPNLRHEIAHGRVIDLPIADSLKVAWTTVDDAGRLAACLLRPDFDELTIRCAGRRAYGGQDLAAAFSAALGREIGYRSTGLDVFQHDIESAIGARAAAPVVAKFRFLSRFPEDAQRMLGTPWNAANAPHGFQPTDLHDWLRMNRECFRE